MPTLGTYDPLQTLASRGDINEVRNMLEVAPIEVFGHVYDCDPEKSEIRMRDKLRTWDREGATSVEWTLADNTTTPLSKSELQAVYDEMPVLRGLRAGPIHVKAAIFKSLLGVITVRDIQPENW